MRSVTASAPLSPWRAGLGDAVRRIARHAGLAGWLFVFVALVLVWQVALSLALFGGFIHLVAYVGVEAGGCAALAAWLMVRLNSAAVDERNVTALQILAWSALAGPFGAFAATALTFPRGRVASSVSRDGGAEAGANDPSAIERAERAHIALLDHRIRVEGACRIRPLMDVVAEGSRTERLEALRVVYRKYDPRLSPVLKRALYDPDASVRVLAATVMAKLHGTHTRVIGDHQTEAAANPHLEQNWLTLAEARLAYAQSALLEPPRARAQIEYAVGDLLRATELNPANRAAAALLESTRRRMADRER